MSKPFVPDKELLSAYLERGDEEAFGELITRYRGLVCSVAGRVVPGADVEDVAQATFVALAWKGRQVDAGCGLAPWLHRVAYRASLDWMRSAGRRREREAMAEPEIGGAGRANRLDELDMAIDRLPDKLRRVVVAHYLVGRSMEEIASVEGCSPSAISMRLTRARDALRRSLGPALALTAMAEAPAMPTVASLLEFVRLHRVAGSSSGTPLGELVQSLLKPTWREIAGPFWAGVGAVTAVVVGMALIPSLGASGRTDREDWRPVSRLAPPPPAAPSPTPPAADPPLIAAIKENPPFLHSQALVKVIASSGAPDLSRDSAGATPLHWAIRKRAEDYAALLLHRGAAPDSTDHRGRTPLHEAVEAGLDSTLFLLILRGADLEASDQAGLTPLGLAASRGNARAAEILLWAGANPEGVTASGPEVAELIKIYREPGAPTATSFSSGLPAFVRNPVHEAARRGNFPLLEELVAGSGPGPNIRNESGRTPLHEAISAGREEVVFYLLMMGADPGAQDHKGRSPLGSTMYWLGGGLDANRRHLLARGANPHALRGDGHTELTWAVLRDNEHGVQWLLWMGADPQQRTPHGTPFEVAVQEGNQRIIDLLRRYGIDGKVRLSDEPSWLLHNGAKRGDLALIDEAISRGAPVDLPDESGNSPLMTAILKRNVATARHLLGQGASLDFLNAKNGASPLSATMIWDYPEMTDFRRELLEAGADPDIRLHDGTTAVMRGIWHHPTTPLKQLIEYGADLNARDNKGRTALRRAIDEGKLETAEFLRAQGATE
ncbi:MAG: hypothetical protein Fur0032_23280 [Terrimicrobiaceae bacterium]